jgi:hypothetical protein
MRCHVLVLMVAHSVLGVCVVSYNKLHCRANATKLGSILPTISKKVSACWRPLIPMAATKLSPLGLIQSLAYVLSAIINNTVVPTLAGNVLICHVFPSLHLQTCCVVSRHIADTSSSSVMLATWRHCMSARVSKQHDIWQHVATFEDISVVLSKTLWWLGYSYVWADLNLTAFIGINWVCRGLFCFLHVVQRTDRQRGVVYGLSATTMDDMRRRR